MVIDTSAVLAILFDEEQRRAFNEAIERDEVRLMSAATHLECSIVLLARFGEDGIRDLDLFLATAKVEVEGVTEEHARIARRGYQEFGKGRHRAALDFADCFSYALAVATGEPLLFKGDDFANTDVTSAV